MNSMIVNSASDGPILIPVLISLCQFSSTAVGAAKAGEAALVIGRLIM